MAKKKVAKKKVVSEEKVVPVEVKKVYDPERHRILTSTEESNE